MPVGTRLVAKAGWEEYSVLAPDTTDVDIVKPGTTLVEAMGPLGLNSLTAYFGVVDVCAPNPGDVLVVSGAAGSTGSVAAQIGKLSGCTVVGIAGGADKCAWLREELNLDVAIDYRNESVKERLAAEFPKGIDRFFDNVGGQILEDVFANLSRHARVAICGQISGYDGSSTIMGSIDMMRLVYDAITIRGFYLPDYAQRYPEARSQLGQWLDAGLLKHREDVREGFDQIPTSFRALFEGSNEGTLLVAMDEDARATD